MTDVLVRCADCAHFELRTSKCKRYPPTLVVGAPEQHPSIFSAWPTVSPNDRCGEWKASER